MSKDQGEEETGPVPNLQVIGPQQTAAPAPYWGDYRILNNPYLKKGLWEKPNIPYKQDHQTKQAPYPKHQEDNQTLSDNPSALSDPIQPTSSISSAPPPKLQQDQPEWNQEEMLQVMHQQQGCALIQEITQQVMEPLVEQVRERTQQIPGMTEAIHIIQRRTAETLDVMDDVEGRVNTVPREIERLNNNTNTSAQNPLGILQNIHEIHEAIRVIREVHIPGAINEILERINAQAQELAQMREVITLQTTSLNNLSKMVQDMNQVIAENMVGDNPEPSNSSSSSSSRDTVPSIDWSVGHRDRDRRNST
ncbi:hypothetical protein BDV93DRAFT_507928 [Ceratobasidium sp. AG-I]|nr:hypothetical protein BDV93DRAFT_507928 [Ceratobasidium sp. AG-I]